MKLAHLILIAILASSSHCMNRGFDSSDPILTLIKKKGIPDRACWGDECHPHDGCIGFNEHECCDGSNRLDITIVNNNINRCECGTSTLPSPSPSPSPSPDPFCSAAIATRCGNSAVSRCAVFCATCEQQADGDFTQMLFCIEPLCCPDA